MPSIQKCAIFAVLVLCISAKTYVFADDGPQSASDAEAPAQIEKRVFERSKDTHSIDELPKFDAQEPDSAPENIEKTAEEQIKQSLKEGTLEKQNPQTSGKVIVNHQQKLDAASESTRVLSQDEQDKLAPLASEVSRRPTVALALGGGGARGAAHIGVLRVLKEAGITVDYIVGNSMGAIVGGLYSAGVPLNNIEKIMLDDSLRTAYMPGPIPPKLLISPLAKIMHPLKKHYAGLWSGKNFSKFLDKQLPSNVVNIEDTPIPFSAIATNLIDGKAYRISNGRLSTAIRASSTIPPLLQPVAIDDKVYIDGGVRANLPASAARDTGADIVIAVLVDEPLRKMPAKKFRHLSGIAERMGDVMLAVADARQLPFADLIINPDVSGLPVINGHAEDARKAIAAGDAATRKALPVIEKILATKLAQVQARKLAGKQEIQQR